MRDHRGTWRYTDSRGTTLELPERPRRVASVDLLVTSTLAAAGVHPVAAALGPDPDHDVCFAAAGFDPDGVVPLDTPDDPSVDLSRLAAARPDLVVCRHDWEAAPPAAIVLPLKERGQSLDTVLAEASRLAVALGASRPDGRAAYERAKQRVAASLAGRTVLFGYARNGRLSVLDPTRYPWLVTLAELGVRVVGPYTAEDGPHGGLTDWDDVAAELVFVNGGIPPGVTATAWDEDWHAFSYRNYAHLFTRIAA